MFKKFDFNEVWDSYILQCAVDNIVSINFGSCDKKEKKRLLMSLDSFVSEKSGIPCSIIKEEKDEENTSLDDIYIGDLDNYNSGLKLILAYLFYKRQQFQRYCLENDLQTSFNDVEIEALKYSYKGSPITGEKIDFPYNEKDTKYLFYYHNAEAYVYASSQLMTLLKLIDYKRINRKLNYFELHKSKYMIKDVINLCKKNLGFLQNLNNKKYLNNKMRILEDKIEEDYKFVDSIHEELRAINNKFNIKTFCCFNKRIWQNLSFKEKIVVVESCNEQLSKMMDVDVRVVNYLEDKLFDLNEFSVSVGDIKEKEGIDVLRSLIFSCCASYVVKKLENENTMILEKLKNEIEKENYISICDSNFIKELSAISKKVQGVIYDNIKIEYPGGGKQIFGDKKEFICDLEKQIGKGKIRKC